MRSILMDSYCVEVDELDGVHIATVTTAAGTRLTVGSRYSAFAAVCEALACLLPSPEAG
jgi:hypothetical protein